MSIAELEELQISFLKEDGFKTIKREEGHDNKMKEKLNEFHIKW
jgi:hypothetical protein